MKNLISLAILILLFSSCNDRIPTKKKVPAGIIGKETMAKIIADIHISESMQVDAGKTDSATQKINVLYYAIFKKYDISRKEYEKSLDYYTRNPDILAEIYENVTEILNTRKIE